MEQPKISVGGLTIIALIASTLLFLSGLVTFVLCAKLSAVAYALDDLPTAQLYSSYAILGFAVYIIMTMTVFLFLYNTAKRIRKREKWFAEQKKAKVSLIE